MTRRDWLLLVGATTLVMIGALPVLAYPMARDTGVFGVIAWRWLDGGLPFVDAWDFKPPAIYVLYAGAMALFGRTPAALRALDLLLFPLMALCIYLIARLLSPHRQGGEAGALGVIAFGAFYFRESFWSLTQNDGLALVPMLAATVCAFAAASNLTPKSPLHDGTTNGFEEKIPDSVPIERGLSRLRSWNFIRQGGIWAAFLAGAFAALTLWFKYTFVLFIVALVIGHVVNLWAKKALRALPIHALAFTAGGLLIGLGGIAWLAALGILDDTIQSALLVAPYAGMYTETQAWYESPVWIAGVEERFVLWWPLLLLAALWLIGLTIPRFRQNVRIEILTIWLWGAAMLLNVLWQAKGISYQWLPILPPLILIGVHLITVLVETIFNAEAQRRRERLIKALIVAGLLIALFAQTWLPALAYFSGNETQSQYFARFRGGEFMADESLAVADYLRARVAPGDSLYIWGFRPEIYYLTGTRPATRFISQFPLVSAWYPPEWKQENVDLLWAALPPYVLVLRGDNMPWVTGRTEDSRQLLQAYTDLNNWLIYNYVEETTIGSFIVYRRSDLTPNPSP